ncbi:retron St85 family RNA-directed DNA polymerase [Pseudomonas sp. HK3]
MDIYKNLSEALLIDEEEIIDYIARAPYRYKVYQIPKRNMKGSRTIAQPARELKIFQKLSLDYPLLNLPVHDSAFAYRNGIGIKKNAKMHSHNQYLLKMDFENFFPSITDDDLVNHIVKYHGSIGERDEIAIRKIFFWKKKGDKEKRLSIGAPSSPFISNTVLFEFDEMLDHICKSLMVTYTRYADDLTFTTNEKGVLSRIPKLVEQVLETIKYPKLKINSPKTIYSSKKSNRHITGLVISNDNQVSLGRKRKRYIRSLVFKFDNNELSSEEVLTLKGLISFAKHVEPSFYMALIGKYKFNVITRILKFEPK